MDNREKITQAIEDLQGCGCCGAGSIEEIDAMITQALDQAEARGIERASILCRKEQNVPNGLYFETQIRALLPEGGG